MAHKRSAEEVLLLVPFYREETEARRVTNLSKVQASKQWREDLNSYRASLKLVILTLT